MKSKRGETRKWQKIEQQVPGMREPGCGSNKKGGGKEREGEEQCLACVGHRPRQRDRGSEIGAHDKGKQNTEMTAERRNDSSNGDSSRGCFTYLILHLGSSDRRQTKGPFFRQLIQVLWRRQEDEDG